MMLWAVYSGDPGNPFKPPSVNPMDGPLVSTTLRSIFSARVASFWLKLGQILAIDSICFLL